MGPEAESGLGPLCQRLDHQLLRYLREMELLSERRGRLERLMEQGWFSLSKARYSMGNKWVSSLQYGPEMVPLAQVDASLKEDGHYSFKVERVDSGDGKRTGSVPEERKKIEEIGAKEQVRRRKARLRGEEERKLLSEDELAHRSQALKEDLVMELAAEVATLQSSLLSTKAQYQALLRQKQKLIGHQTK